MVDLKRYNVIWYLSDANGLPIVYKPSFRKKKDAVEYLEKNKDYSHLREHRPIEGVVKVILKKYTL